MPLPASIAALPGMPQALMPPTEEASLGIRTAVREYATQLQAQPAPVNRVPLATPASASPSGAMSLLPPPTRKTAPASSRAQEPVLVSTGTDRAALAAQYPHDVILNSGDTFHNKTLWAAYEIPPGSAFSHGEAVWLQEYNPNVQVPGSGGANVSPPSPAKRATQAPPPAAPTTSKVMPVYRAKIQDSPGHWAYVDDLSYSYLKQKYPDAR